MKKLILLVLLVLPFFSKAQTKTKIIFSSHHDMATRHTGNNYPYTYKNYPDEVHIFKCTYINNKLVKISDSCCGMTHCALIYKHFMLESKNENEEYYSCRALHKNYSVFQEDCESD